MDTSWAQNIETKKEQGTHSWHEWRGKGLGSSDAPVLLGKSPWKDLGQLYLEKTGQGEPFKGNWATERGTRLEPVARKMYNERYSAQMEPGTGESSKHAFMRASFDGIDYELQRLIEIKCPGAPDHQVALSGHIPEKYKAQCQWLMMVTGFDELDYVSFDGEKDLVVVKVKPDLDMQRDLTDKAIWFWTLVINKTPPPNTKQPIKEINDSDLLSLLEKQDALKKEIDSLTLSYEMIRDSIRMKAKQSIICGPFTIKWSDRIGAVDYAKVPELKGLDLSKYRKESTKVMTVQRLK